MTVVLGVGLVVCAGYAATLQRRLSLVADAEHELRGPLSALVLAAHSAAPGGIDTDVARVRLAIDDLAAARRGRRAPAAPELRVAQAVGNLVANAEEHGGGVVELRSRMVGARRLIEIRDRGRGLAIARRAARDAGGSVDLDLRSEGSVARLELPGS